jgi:hypothetical protein
MTKELEFDKLFNEWQAEQSKNGLSKFCKDGIINEEIYSRERIKVLILSNEANDEKNGDNLSDRREDFRKYSSREEKDWWHGKMRQRSSEMYKLIVGAAEMSNPKAASHFAVMNLNKSGGGSTTDIKKLELYCNNYKSFILKELEIIEPDIIIWSGCKSFDCAGIRKILGVEKEKKGANITIKGKKVPVIRMWHFSYYQAKNKPLENYENRITGKLMAKLKEELEAIGWEM